jgi:hypothetical protein
VGSSQHENVEEAAGSGTDGITVVVFEPFPFADLTSVLKVDECVVKGRGDVDPVSLEVAPVVVQIRPHKQATHQDCQGKYKGQSNKMLHFGGCPDLRAHNLKAEWAPVSYKRSVSLLPPFTLHFLISLVVFFDEIHISACYLGFAPHAISWRPRWRDRTIAQETTL